MENTRPSRDGGPSKCSPKSRLARSRLARQLTSRAAQAIDRIVVPDEEALRLFMTVDDGSADMARLKRALRREQSLGRAGHPAYDLNRHIAIRQALKALEAR